MLIFNTTYTDFSEQQEINELIGNSFSMLEKIRLKGIGSARIQVHAVSENFTTLIKSITDVTYANIELRPKGIIVHVTQQLRRYAWVIPYNKLQILKGAFISVYSEESYMQMLTTGLCGINDRFLNKMIKLKKNYVENHTYFECNSN